MLQFPTMILSNNRLLPRSLCLHTAPHLSSRSPHRLQLVRRACQARSWGRNLLRQGLFWS